MPVLPPYSGISINSARRLLTRNFEGAGIESAALDARMIVGHVTGLTHFDMLARGTDFLTPEQFDKMSEMAARRMAGSPVDMLTGQKAFWKDVLRVTEDVLSPRPETEGIIEAALTLERAPKSVLDLGTGSGAIALSLAAEFPDAAVTATDISDAALVVAKDNAARLGRDCKFIKSDWFERVSGTYDLIVSNPPYITDVAMTGLPKEVTGFDPDLALRGGPDGLLPYRIIAADAPDFLTPGGHMILEIGFDQGSAVTEILATAGFENVSVIKDLAGHDRIITAHVSGVNNA